MEANRVFALLLAVVMLLSIFTGCNTVEPGVTNPSGSIENTADHTETDGMDSTAGSAGATTGTDSTTGTTENDPAGNETISGTENTEPGTESSNPSGETSEPTACAHNWSNWSTTKAVACDTNGTRTRKCSKCGNEETQTIAATGHAWDEGKVTVTPTSCSDTGIKIYTCKTCGKTKTEQIKGSHTFGEWKYEEYTYQAYSASGKLKTYTSHRKVRVCSKCGYKETGGTPDHSCKIGSANHTEKVIEKATCTTEALVRSTCTICGWYTDYRTGGTGAHTNKTETRHLTDYGPYTNELDAEISTCTVCGMTSTRFIYGEGWSDYNRYSVKLTLAQGNAEDVSLDNPTHQAVRRDFVYDSDGYVKQFTLYWWYNGQRYSQVIKCDKASMIAWFAEYGLNTTGNESYIIKPDGRRVVPYKTTYTG